jgi:hypothetical protein
MSLGSTAVGLKILMAPLNPFLKVPFFGISLRIAALKVDIINLKREAYSALHSLQRGNPCWISVMKREGPHLQVSYWRPFSMQSLVSMFPSASHFILMLFDLGHCNLFIKGVLHQDVSGGNILHYSQPVHRPALDM